MTRAVVDFDARGSAEARAVSSTPVPAVTRLATHSADPAHPLVSQLRRISRYSALLVGAIGAIGLVGWAADVAVLKSVSPTWVAMKANTALCFLLSGLALTASQETRVDRPRARLVAVVSAALLGIIALLTIGEYASGVDLGIDQLLFREPPGTVGTFAPGRMALNAAICFAVVAAGIGLLARRGGARIQPYEVAGAAVGALATHALLGYVLGADFSVGAGPYTLMAVHTTVAFLLSGVSLVCARPGQGWASIATDTAMGGKLARRLVPAVALVPLCVGLLGIAGRRAGWFDDAFGASMRIVLETLIVAGVITVLARSLGRESDACARVSNALLASEERSRATLNGIGDAVISTDLYARVEAMNPVAEELTGWRVGDALGKPLVEVFRIVHESTRASIEDPAERVLRDGPVVGDASCTMLLRRGGGERPIRESGAPIHDAAGRVIGVVLVFRDATAERAAQEALDYRARLVESIDDAVVATDCSARIRMWNRGAERMYGWTESEAIGKFAPELLSMHFATAPPPSRGTGAGRAPPRSSARTHAELRCRNRAAQLVDVEMTTSTLADAGGSVTGYVSVHRDVTERKELQAKLTVAERMASVGTLAAGVAHEINNPLAYISANMTFAADALRVITSSSDDASKVAPLGEVLEALTEAQEGCRRVSNIVRDLNAFSRGTDEVVAPCDVERVLSVSINVAGNEIRHRARLVLDLASVPLVEAVESRLGQVFLNVLVNAAQAISPGAVDANEIRVTTSVAGDGRVMVQVRDSGAGMAPDVLARVFDPYFTTKPMGIGTGLGLPISHGIVTGLGGDIRIESAPGEGTTVSILLPASVRAQPDLVRAASVRPTVARSCRVLVVDDEPVVAKALARLIGKAHEVVIETSAQQALTRIEGGERFDAVFCDVMMPKMTGMALHGAVERLAPEQAARMVFVTGGAFTAEARQFLAGMQHRRLDKPFDRKAVIGMLGELLDRQATRGSDEARRARAVDRSSPARA